MCEFNQFYFSEEGYVAYCKNCKYFQLAFGSTLLTLTESDFNVLHNLTEQLIVARNDYVDEEIKQVIIPTPYPGMNMLLTIKELRQLDIMLEEAENEMASQALLTLFNEIH